jgi:hypothetical protein
VTRFHRVFRVANATSDDGAMSDDDDYLFDELDSDMEIDDELGGDRRGLGQRVRERIACEYEHRYQAPREPLSRPPASLPHVLNVWKHERPDQFRGVVRVSPATFDQILGAIAHDPVFTSDGRDQMPVDHQLALALYRFGRYGNGVRLEDVASWAGVGKGTVLLYTRRVIRALTRKTVLLEAIQWPSDEEIEEAKDWVEHASGCREWRRGWCMVDGTLVPLYARPHWYGESYYDRKCNYSLGFQVSRLATWAVRS